jgi:glycosyltransferase involved in cell wall biosynthesis
MEVILVDDGSPDRCPQMCDEWAAKDARIRVVHKENGGLSDARNAALDMVTGDFVTFVDSDDWLSDNTYPPLLDIIGDSDLLEYSISGRLQLGDCHYDNADEYWLREQAYCHTYACNKIYKRSLFDGVRFPKGRVFEDAYTLPLLLRKAAKIATTHLGFYHYECNPESISATAGGQHLAQLLDAHLNNRMPIDDNYYMHLVNIQMDVWEQTGAAVTLPVRRIDTAGLTGRRKLKAIGVNILGVKALCRISKIIHRFKNPSRL